jgi:hypothetical protein
MGFGLGKLTTDAPPPPPAPRRRGGGGGEPPSSPVEQPASQQQEKRASAAAKATQHRKKQTLDQRHESWRTWKQGEVDARRTKFGPKPLPGEEGHNPEDYNRERLERLVEHIKEHNPEFRRQVDYERSREMVRKLVAEGIPGFAYVKLGPGSDGKPVLRPIPGTAKGGEAQAIADAFAEDERLAALNLDTPQARLERIATDSGISFSDFNDLQRQVHNAVRLGRVVGQATHAGGMDTLAMLLTDAGQRLQAEGGDNLRYYGDIVLPGAVLQHPGGAAAAHVPLVEPEVLPPQAAAGAGGGGAGLPPREPPSEPPVDPPDPAGQQDLGSGGIPRTEQQQRDQSSNAVDKDTSDAAKGEEEKNAFKKWFAKEGVAGVNRGWLTAGGVGAAGLALAAYLASSGGQQQDPSSYRDQQISANSYGSY